MKPVGMCRMCIVEVDTGRGPALQPACMLEVAEGMSVDTESEVTKKAQDGILEFLLINHPLDCPVCDKGGECPLQDQTLAFGPGESRFIEEKRHYEKPIALSPLVYMDRERCILCDRCTRFSAEVAGDPLISFINRGNETEVNTFPDDPFASYFSGNTVQICPVGALTAVPYRFKARPWDLDQVESTCTSCAVGCRVAVQSSSNKLVRYLGVDVDPVNHGWLCDKGRFDFEATGADERIAAPLVDGQETSWSDALAKAADALQAATVAVVGGARLTNEDAYTWSKLARTVIGTDDVDCQLGDGLPAEVVLGLPRATIDEACAADVVVLLAPDLKEELPILYLRLREAVVDHGLEVIELSASDTGMTRYATTSVRYSPGEAASAVREIAAHLRGTQGSVVCVLGRPSLAESAEGVVAAAGALADAVPGVVFLSALRRANVHGALDMGLAPGMLPGRVSLDAGREWFATWGELPAATGRDTRGILEAAAAGELQTLVLLGADPLADFPDRELARRALDGAGTVIAVDCFLTESSRRAGIVLAAAAYAEKPGTTTNLEGRVSRLNQKVTPPGTSRPDWMIAVELADRMGESLGVESLEDIWDEIERLAPSHAGITRTRLATREGLDGVVVGRGPSGRLSGEHGDAVPAAHPPTMAQTEAPEIVAAQEQGETQFLPVTERTSAGEQPVTSDDAVPAGADAAPADETHPAPAEATEAVAASGAAPARPALVTWRAPDAQLDPPPIDAYSLRLVVSRRLYDAGTLVQHSPSLAGLAAPAALHVNPTDLERLGVTSGGRVRVTSSRTSRTLDAVADAGVPRGSAVLPWGDDAAELIDVRSPVTDARVETL
jgi:NADH-quinone oxidoreductase subunit G